MTLIIELSPAAEQQFATAAAANGQALQDYISARLERAAQEEAENHADALRAEARLAEPGEPITWEQIKAEAGLV